MNKLGVSRELAEYILGTYFQYADHNQCIDRFALSIALNNGRNRGNAENVVSRAAVANGQQLITFNSKPDCKIFLIEFH